MKETNPNIDKALEIVPYLCPDNLTVQLIEDFHRKKELDELSKEI